VALGECEGEGDAEGEHESEGVGDPQGEELGVGVPQGVEEGEGEALPEDVPLVDAEGLSEPSPALP
jgi:hypothetical protein